MILSEGQNHAIAPQNGLRELGSGFIEQRFEILVTRRIVAQQQVVHLRPGSQTRGLSCGRMAGLERQLLVGVQIGRLEVGQVQLDRERVLFERVREREGLAYTAGASRISDFQSGMVYFHAASEKKNLARIIEIFNETAKDASAGNFGVGRFENAKTAIKARNGANMQDPASWASAAGYSLLAFGRIFSEGEINAAIDAVTPAEVAALAEKLFKNPFVLKAL